MVVTDIRMPPTGTDEGIRAAEVLRETHPDMGVVVLSQYSEPAYALAFLDGGSKGRAYLLKERVSDIGQLAGAIREVAGGGSVIDPEVVDALVAARAKPADSPLHRLTARESEILSEMAQGKNNAAVAASLVLSERAVEKHINSIFSKLALSPGARRPPPGEGGAPLPVGPERLEPRRVASRPGPSPAGVLPPPARSCCQPVPSIPGAARIGTWLTRRPPC